MKVYVNRTAGGWDAFDIWFVLEDFGHPTRQVGRFVASEAGLAHLEWVDHEPGAHAEPTLRLGAREVQDLRAGLDEYGPTTGDNLMFLGDVIGTRDRLLTLVERLTGSTPAATRDVSGAGR